MEGTLAEFISMYPAFGGKDIVSLCVANGWAVADSLYGGKPTLAQVGAEILGAMDASDIDSDTVRAFREAWKTYSDAVYGLQDAADAGTEDKQTVFGSIAEVADEVTGGRPWILYAGVVLAVILLLLIVKK